MSGHSHPGEETLLRYAAGTLSAGPRLLVEIHLGVCPACRAAVRAFEALGGVLLDATAPLALSDHALADTLARIDAGIDASSALARHATRHAEARAAAAGPALPEGVRLPRPLAARRVGTLMPVAPGVRLAKVRLEEDPSANVLLFRIGPGRALPRHSHAGVEFTQVISGGFSDPFGHYGPGDLVEADGEVDHAPRVDPDGDCVCLAAFEGRLKFHGLLGVVMRPFL